MSYPPAPWALVGQLWMSLFRVPERVDAQRPAGIYGAAFVSYEPDSPLTYSELLVARLARSPGHGRCITINDIWVDSPASRSGGRELWAIPKELCDFRLETSHVGPLSRTEWSASLERRPIARAEFTDLSRGALRLPFRSGTWQPALATQSVGRAAPLSGSAKMLPCRATWEFDRQGPLGWLHGRRRLGSLRMADLRLNFG